MAALNLCGISENNKMPPCICSINKEAHLRLESKVKRKGSDLQDMTFKATQGAA